MKDLETMLRTYHKVPEKDDTFFEGVLRRVKAQAQRRSAFWSMGLVRGLTLAGATALALVVITLNLFPPTTGTNTAVVNVSFDEARTLYEDYYDLVVLARNGSAQARLELYDRIVSQLYSQQGLSPNLAAYDESDNDLASEVNDLVLGNDTTSVSDTLYKRAAVYTAYLIEG